jgi:hypothetical protein
MGSAPLPKAAAQATSGIILGTIQDPNGAALPEATVTVTNVGTSESKSVQTDREGNYQVLYLIPGKYEVSADKSGFAKVTHSAFDLLVDEKARIDLTLRVGNVAQTVMISSAPPQLDTDSSEVGTVIQANQITTLPLNVRNFTQLLDLTTGTSPNYSAQGGSLNADHPEGLSATNVNGVGTDGVNWQIDGMQNNEGFFSVLTVNPSIDAIQEFKATTSNYSAEFGRVGGAVVQISIKSGTNAFHGVAFEFLRNSALDANDFFSKQAGSPIPPFKQNQFGGNLGGPIRKDKTFFFADYEGYRSELGQTEIMSLPTMLQRQGIFTETDPVTGASQPTIYNPVTHLPYPGNTVTNIDPVAAKIEALLPEPNLTGPGGAPLLTNNYFGKETESHPTNSGDVRVDHHLSDKDQAFIRYSILSATLAQPPFLGTVAGGDPFLAAISKATNQNGVISDVHTFSPTLLNEFRVGLNSVHLNWAAYDSNTNTSADVGIPGVNDFCPFCGGLVHINISGLSDFGHTPYAPTLRHTTIIEFLDNVTMIRGKHSIKAGADISRVRASLFQTSNPVGEFDFDQNQTSNGVTGGIGYASFLTGYAADATRDTMTGYPSYRTNQLAFFVQDDVRATKKLTLNLGVRYEIYSAPTENKNRQANFDLATGDLLDACIATSCTGGVHTDYLNIEPRVGFAYNPDPRTVVRGAFGDSAYTPGSGGQLGSLAENQPWVQGQDITPPTPFTPGPTFSQGLPAPPPLQPRPGAGAGHYIASGGSDIWMDPNLRMTKPYQWNLDVQRTLLRDLVLDIGYVGNAVVGVYITPPLNYPELNPTSTLTVQERRPYYATNPDLQEVGRILNTGHSDYHSLQVRLDKRFSSGLSFMASYTWSKFLQRGSDYVNPDLYMQKDVNSQDIAHRFVGSYTYELPVGRGKRFGTNMNALANGAIGGWQFQGITSLRTGLPFSATLASSFLDNGLGNVPNRTGSPLVANPTIKYWFNWNVFTQPGDQYGNAPYNSMRGPGEVNWDMSLFKNIQFTESRYLQFRTEFFNAFNNVQFGNPNANICGGTCGEGTITSLAAGSNPREIQFALKLYF